MSDIKEAVGSYVWYGALFASLVIGALLTTVPFDTLAYDVCEAPNGSKTCTLSESQCISQGSEYHAGDKCSTTSTATVITTIECDLNKDKVCDRNDLSYVLSTAFGTCSALEASLNQCQQPINGKVPQGTGADLFPAGGDGLVGFREIVFMRFVVCNKGDQGSCDELNAMWAYIHDCAAGSAVACEAIKSF